jgi:adenylate kinase
MDFNKRYIFLGPPGSGKGTQAKIVAKALDLPHIDMGSTIRAAIRNESEAGRMAKSYVDAGQLVPDEVVIAMAEERLNEGDTGSGFILDGYPRSLKQADALEKYLSTRNMGIRVLNLNIPMELIVDRLTSRLMCRNCGAVYNTKTNPPRNQGVCDVDGCNGELYQRNDDKPETITARFKTYEAETAPLIDFYSSKGVLMEIEATGNIDEITLKIMEKVK